MKDDFEFDYSDYVFDPGGRGISNRVMAWGHKALEDTFPCTGHENDNVLEIGAGHGGHYPFVSSLFDSYLATDISEFNLDTLGHRFRDESKVSVLKCSAYNISELDQQFDRIIACHVLEHMLKPHEVLREMYNCTKPGGYISLLLPSDPGIAWRLSRRVSSIVLNKQDIPYDYVMAREHVNSINSLVAFIHYYFDNIVESWRPFYIPSMDINLFYACHIRKT